MCSPNSNPYLDYPRPMLHKTVPIGGIAVHIDPKKNELSKKWDSILNERNTTVLVSFGSVAKAIYMPDEYKENLLEVFKSMPETTFIWKYEAEGSQIAAQLENVHVSTWVPQNALLADPRLTAFITHGGLGSTTELAHLGKPGDTGRSLFLLIRQEMPTCLRNTVEVSFYLSLLWSILRCSRKLSKKSSMTQASLTMPSGCRRCF
ncbi:hypothetical protein COOONC_22017 [Cooperia oncophora]